MRDLQGLNLLIAEDFEDTQELLKLLFEGEGARVATADNGLEAVVRARLEAFDAILMDLDMPEMDGFEATRKLRAGGYHGLIIALSAGTASESASLSSDFSFQASKPLSAEGLARIKAELLRRPAPVHNGIAAPMLLSETQVGLRIRFQEALPQHERQLRACIEDGDFRKIRELAHRLRGIGSMAGYPEITDAAAAAESNHSAGGALLEVIQRILRTPT